MKSFLAVSFLFAGLSISSCCPGPEGAWHPERTDYPRLIYTADQIDGIVARLDHYPYDVLYDRVLSRAAGTPDFNPGPYDPSAERRNGDIAKSAAFVHAVEGDEAYRDKAIEILENLDTELAPFTIDLFLDDIHIAEALMCYAQAFDMLLGAGDLPESDRILIEARLGALTESFFRTWASVWCWYY